LPASYRNNHTNTADMRLRESIADANDLTVQAMQKRAADRWVSGLNMTEIDKPEQMDNLAKVLAYTFNGATLPFGLMTLGPAVALNPVATGASLIGSTLIGEGANWAVDKLTGKRIGQWINKGLGISDDNLFGYVLDPSYMASANRFADKVARSFAQNAIPFGYDRIFNEKIWPTVKGIPNQYYKYLKSKITGEPAVIMRDTQSARTSKMHSPASMNSRRTAVARALGLPIEGGDLTYIPNIDGTVSVSKKENLQGLLNSNKISEITMNRKWGDEYESLASINKGKPEVLDETVHDFFTIGGNGGNINTRIYNIDTGKSLARPRDETGHFLDGVEILNNNKDKLKIQALDDFDLNFLQPYKPLVKKLPKSVQKIADKIINVDGIKILGGTPFTMKQTGNVKVNPSEKYPFKIEWQFPEFQTDVATNIKDVYGLPSRYELGSRASQMLGHHKGELFGGGKKDDDEENKKVKGGKVNRFDGGGEKEELFDIAIPSLYEWDNPDEFSPWKIGSRFFPYQLPDVIVTSPYNMRRLALERSRATNFPNTNFDKAIDITETQKLKNNLFPWAATCINTVTSYYNTDDESHQLAVNQHLFDNHDKWGYEVIPQDEARPGDLVQFIDKNGRPHHLMIFDGIATSDGDAITGTGEKIGEYRIGDTLLNGSAGGRTRASYRHKQPINMHREGETHRYYRFKQNKSKK